MLRDSLPQFVREMREMALLLNVDQTEIDKMETYIEEMVRQFWISSGSAGRRCWRS